MFRRLMLTVVLCWPSFEIVRAITSLDTGFVARSVVFFFAADLAGRVEENHLVATGFLIIVPNQAGQDVYPLLITARHVVDPEWAGCRTPNPSRLFLRVNNMHYESHQVELGVSYVPVDLLHNGQRTWTKSDDDTVDVAVLRAPPELLSGQYDVRFLKVRNFGKPEEVAKIGVSSQTASAGLVPGVEGKRRNNAVFHFGKIASIPEEPATFQCTAISPIKPLQIWWLATTLVPGTSGSPIYFDPLFPPNGDISSGEPRSMLIGLQSLSVPGADLSGMTPARLILDVIGHAVPSDADLRLGLPQK
jgi:hypothetical protein